MTRALNLEQLRTELLQCRFGKEIIYLQQTDSTQNLAQERIRLGAGEGLLIIAESQTAGRGRLGRKWHSPEGSGVYMSLVLQPRVPHRYMPQLTVVAAVALCRSLRRLTKADIRVKWPNDLYADHRKISGILMESGPSGSVLGPSTAVLGVGISVNVKPEHIPEWLKDKATSLFAVTNQEWEREKIIADFLRELEVMVDLYKSAGFGIFRTLWEVHAWRPDKPLAMRTKKGLVRGFPEAIDEHGALLVRSEDGHLQVVQPGDYGIET